MNREKEDQLPLMQVGFIDSICLPIYEVNNFIKIMKMVMIIISLVCITVVLFTEPSIGTSGRRCEGESEKVARSRRGQQSSYPKSGKYGGP